MLTVDRLTKQFGGFTALNGVAFEVKEGEILGLIGPNGSGKTTCFNCISGALAPSAGSIRFKGDEIGGLTPDGPNGVPGGIDPTPFATGGSRAPSRSRVRSAS